MTGTHDGERDPDATAPFRFEYRPGTIRYGDGCVAHLSDELAAQGLERALVVCGRTVGSTPAVVDPVREGLGDRFAGLFAETTPEKRLVTAVAGVEAMADADADALVGLGGGSSLDVARAMAVLAASDREPERLAGEMAASGDLPVPDGVPPLFVVPTTLAGADLSMGGGITAAPENGLVDEATKGSMWDGRLLPAGAFYDPALVATTPRKVLARSAMNGFDKGVETLYAPTRTAITDATGARGLARFAEGLLAFGDGCGPSGGDEDGHEAGLAAAVEGLLLVQYGVSRPDAHALGPIHALAKQVARVGGCSQGVAHAVVAPHLLAALFDRVDGRRALLADALAEVSDPEQTTDDPAAAAVAGVTAVRDALGVPTRLRDLDGPEREEFDEVARAALAHPFFENAPAGFDPSADDLVAVLDAAW